MLDITKQMLGQLFVHTLNVLLSNFAAHMGSQNPCSLYFLNILIDTTLGVFIIYLTLRITTHVLTDVWHLKGFVSGQYSDRPRGARSVRSSGGGGGGSSSRKASRSRSRPKMAYWLKQLCMYFFALLVMKVVVTILFVLFPFLFAFGAWLLDFFGESKNAQVLFVMCLFPLAMNTLQFWLVDSFLRHNPHKSKYAHLDDATAGADGSAPGTPGSSGLPAWGLREQQGRRSTSSEHSGLVDDDDEFDEEEDDDDDTADQTADTIYAPTSKQPQQRQYDVLPHEGIIRSRTSSPASQHSYPPQTEPGGGSVGITIDAPGDTPAAGGRPAG